MSARTGLLISTIALALAGALYLISGNGPGRTVEASPDRETRVEGHEDALELAAPPPPQGEAPGSGRAAVAPAAPGTVAPAPEQPVQTARADVAVLSGYVKDEQGLPVAGARIFPTPTALELIAFDMVAPSALWDEEIARRFQEAITDEQGFFEVVGIPPGQPGLKILAQGFVPQARTDILIAAGEHQTLSNPIVLDASAVVAGVVYDDAGFPLAGATVSASKKKSGGVAMARATGAMSDKGVKTAEDGRFRLDMLDLGELVVVATHPAYAYGTAEIDARAGGSIDGLELRLARGATIQGHVTGLTAGTAESLGVLAIPADFNVMQGGRIRSCDVARDGSFELAGMKDGSTWAVFGYVGEVQDVGPDAHAMLMWGAPGLATNRAEARAGDRGVELEYSPGSTVSFRVVDRATGRPLPRLTISSTMDHVEAEVEDYPGGRVRLEGLRALEGRNVIYLTVDAVGYWARSESFEPTEGVEVDLGVLELDPAVLARFLTVDALTGAPVEGVTVTVEAQTEGDAASHDAWDVETLDVGASTTLSTRGEGESDAEGVASVETLLVGTFVVTARAEGYAPLRLSDVSLTGSDVTPVTLELERGATVRVSVTDTFGQPLPARTVEHRAPGAEEELLWDLGATGQVTDLFGVARFGTLEPGPHRFRIAKLRSGGEPTTMTLLLSLADDEGDDEGSWTTVEVSGTESTELQLVELPTGSLTGRVSEQGKALRRAKLTLRKVDADEELDEDMDPAEAVFRKLGREMAGQGAANTKTERDGSYAFESVDVGDYVLAIDDRKRAMPTEVAVTIVAGDQVLDFDLDLAILAGRVLDAHGDGVKGARVSIVPYVEPSADDEDASKTDAARWLMGEMGVEGKFRTFKTKRDGSFELRGVIPDTEVVVRVDGSQAGYQDATSEPLELRRNELREDLELVVEQGGTLSVTVLEEDGSSTEFVLVRLVRVDGSLDPVNELAMGGTTTIAGLVPGSYRVLADDDPDEDALFGDGLFGDGDPSTIGKVETTVEVVAGKTTTVELRLPE